MKKNLLLLTIFLLLVAGGYFLARGFPWRGEPLMFPNYAKEQTSRIRIDFAEGTEDVELVKEDSQWLVESKDRLPANGDRVNDLLRSTAELERKELVSSNPENQGRYKVNEQGTRVKLWAGERLQADYYIGEIGPSFNSTYVRKEGEDKVYLVYRVLTSVIRPLDWRDLSVLNFNPNEVQSVAVTRGGNDFVIKREGDGWQVGSLSNEVDGDKVNQLINNLAALKAEDIYKADQVSATGLANSNWTYTINLNFGDQTSLVELTIGGEDEAGDYYAQTNRNEYIYRLAEAIVSELPVTASDLAVE